MGAAKPTLDPEWESVVLTDRARDHLENVFLPQYRKTLEAIEQTSLVVLIWGPSSARPELYRKRLQIRAELRKQNVTAMFSEEISTTTDTPYSLSTQELAQARCSDLIVVLQCSIGSTAEVHDFGRIREVASKLLVFVDQDFRSSYSYGALLSDLSTRFNNVREYHFPVDIESCNLMGAVLAQVRVLRQAKWFRGSNEVT